MGTTVRITQVDGAALADCLYLIGQAWVKLAVGDGGAADKDLDTAKWLVPPGTVDAVLRMIGAGEVPAPGSRQASMDAWLETCRMAGAGDLALIRIFYPSARELQREEQEAFFERLAELRADAERRMAAGESADPEPAAKPLSLAGELRAMGLM